MEMARRKMKGEEEAVVAEVEGLDARKVALQRELQQVCIL
jgi:hypothetical protein